ncbi:MAG TPA: inorganic pyrophosphatase [Gammaproteobacteria bacterium]|nr:inorganic pyrophosphatase [Gammaproteobacteria bacterium]
MKPYHQWRPHPWHGLDIGSSAPEVVNAYIEMTPFDLVKYEVDKETGYLMVDRPQRSSAQPPTLYGYIPRTYCGPRVGALGETPLQGDGDPLDICVISERPIQRSQILLTARVVGGLRMNDHGEADDKIIAVLDGDHFWGDAKDLSGVPEQIVERLMHYFYTYKWIPGGNMGVQIEEPYGRERACDVINAARADYHEIFGADGTAVLPG